MAAANSRAGMAMCLGAVPCPYRTAGTLPARRVRRAPPLPNSVRGSALIRTSDTVTHLSRFVKSIVAAVPGGARRAEPMAQSTASMTAPARMLGDALAVATAQLYLSVLIGCALGPGLGLTSLRLAHGLG